MSDLAYSVGASSLTVVAPDGNVHILDSTDYRFSQIADLLRQKKFEDALKKMDLKAQVVEASAGRVTISPDGVTFGGQALAGYMAERLVSMAGAGLDVKPWMMFMDNLMENPSADSREDVFRWMEAGGMPITADGCIVGFKKVRDNYTDVHTGKFSNTVGSVLEMPREKCDPNRNVECSTGFHFCSLGYLSSFSGSRVMLVKVDPRDVTAVPRDYKNTKARCCRYEVTGELSSEAAARHDVFREPVMPVDPSEIPGLMAEGSKGGGPKSPIGTKESSKVIAGNAKAAKSSSAPPKKVDSKPAAPEEKSPPKKSAVSKVVKAVKAKATEVVEAVTEAVTPDKPLGNKARAQQLVAEIKDAKTSKARTKAAAQELLDLRKAKKTTWDKLGVTSDSVELALNAASAPDEPAPPTKKASKSTSKGTTKKPATRATPAAAKKKAPARKRPSRAKSKE